MVSRTETSAAHTANLLTLRHSLAAAAGQAAHMAIDGHNTVSVVNDYVNTKAAVIFGSKTTVPLSAATIGAP